MPDIGTFSPFPAPQSKPPRLHEIALNVMGRLWITRQGYEKLADHFGIGVDYVHDPEAVEITLRHGESILAQRRQAYTVPAEQNRDAALKIERARTDAMRVGLVEMLKEHAPHVLQLGGEILARRA